MSSQTSLAARNCRLRQWAQMIHECNNRPVEMSVDEWCDSHSITKSNYYYRMRQVRKACLEMVSEKAEPSVVPVPMELVNANKVPPAQEKQSFLELVSHGVTLRVTEQTLDSLLKTFLGVLNHVA